jgi:hypothetical protein
MVLYGAIHAADFLSVTLLCHTFTAVTRVQIPSGTPTLSIACRARHHRTATVPNTFPKVHWKEFDTGSGEDQILAIVSPLAMGLLRILMGFMPTVNARMGLVFFWLNESLARRP